MAKRRFKHFVEQGPVLSFLKVDEKGDPIGDHPFMIGVWEDNKKGRPNAICINGDYGTNPSYEEMAELAEIIKVLADELTKGANNG